MVTPKMASALMAIFYLSLTVDTMPDNSCQFIIIPLPKQGSKLATDSYRPISFTCKLIKRLVTVAITDHFDHSNMMPPYSWWAVQVDAVVKNVLPRSFVRISSEVFTVCQATFWNISFNLGLLISGLTGINWTGCSVKPQEWLMDFV